MKKLILIFMLLCTINNAKAISLISDEETQSWLYDLLTPIYKSAELPLNKEYIHIVNDDSLNAFVGDKNHIFVHTGTLTKSSNSNEIEGVLAHETGHILGGHILRLKIKMKDLQQATLTSLLAAAGAAVASGRGDAAIAVILGTQSSAINAMSAYQVTEERAADQTATMLLNKNKKSIRGLKDFMKKIQYSNRLQGIEEIPYFRTHPITTERIAYFEDKLKNEPNYKNNTEMDKRLKRIQAKLYAYLEPKEKVLKRYPLNDSSIEANIAHAIYYMRQKDINNALNYADKLINNEPKNPYFWEIKAQALFESGKIPQSVSAYKETLRLKPDSDIFKISYAEATIANTSNTKELQKLIPLLEQANSDNDQPLANLYLGKIYSEIGNIPTSNYYVAEYNYAIGQISIAKKQLKNALKHKLKPNIELRAKDLEDKMKTETKKNSLF